MLPRTSSLTYQSQTGFTAIVVFVDKLTKMVHLARCKKEVTAMEYAQIFIDNVFRLHGLPKVIISDRDP